MKETEDVQTLLRSVRVRTVLQQKLQSWICTETVSIKLTEEFESLKAKASIIPKWGLI